MIVTNPLPLILNNKSPLGSYVSGFQWQYNNATFVGSDGATPSKIGAYTVVPNVIDGQQAGNTGLDWNPDKNCFVISVYNYAFSSRLWLIKRENLIPFNAAATALVASDFTKEEIILTPYIDHIQGVAYNRAEKSYYVLGTIKGAALADSNRVLICVDDNGNKVRADWYPDFNFEPGMIAINGDKLYIKPNNSISLRIYDIKTYQYLGSTDVFTANEGLAVSPIDGSIYIGGDNGIDSRYNKNFVLQNSLTTNISTGEVEGLAELPDRTLAHGADTRIHGFVNNGNIVVIFDMNSTYRKYISMPDMVPWNYIPSATAKIKEKLLFGSGYVESPIMDFGTYTDYLTNNPITTGNKMNVTIEYRSSATAPTTTVDNTTTTLPIYSGWGATTPSAYSGTKSTARYQQVRITIRNS